MHFSSWRGAAGLAVVVGLLVCGCSGATDDGTSSPPSSEPQGGSAPTAPSVGDSQGAAGSSSGPEDATSVDGDSAPASGTSAGPAVCEPDAPCRGITSCTNSNYGPTRCIAYCQCPDVRIPSSRLTCQLSC